MKIDIAALSLDVKNFRHAKVSHERDAIRYLLEDDDHKVFELAQDIIERGSLDPSSLLIVTPRNDDSTGFIALEGNRRLTALKTLLTPELANGLPSYSKFKALNPAFVALGITSVECVILDREQASIWIKRKHYKGMGGAGVLPWNAVATARSDAAEGKFSRWMMALAYIEERGVDAEEIRDLISKKTTTVERLLTSSFMASDLGIIFDKSGNITPENGDEKAAVELINCLLESMADRAFVEPKISTAALQQEFIRNFVSMSVKKSAPQAGTSASAAPTSPSSGASGSSAGGGGAAIVGAGAAAGAAKSAAGSTSASVRSKPVKLRKMLAKPGLRISNQPLNRFYSELRSLNVEKNPFTSAAIIRVFLEKASTVFLETMGVPPLNTKAGATWHDFDVKLRSKVDAVLKSIDSSSANPKLVYIRDVANGSRDKLHTMDHLNQAIHSHHALPAHSEIVEIWDRFHPYFFELFEAVEKKDAMNRFSPLRYPGGKGKLASYLSEVIELNCLAGGSYAEPFAGGAAVALDLLFSERVRHIHINDIDICVYAFWHSVVNNTEKFVRLVKEVDVNIDSWLKAREIKNTSANRDLLELGFATFFLSRTNRSGIINGGVIGGLEQNGLWKIDCRFNKEDLISRIYRIGAFRSRVNLYNIDASKFIQNLGCHQSDKMFFYIDPPYYDKGAFLYRNHYRHDDHVDIARIIFANLKCKWIISYDNVSQIHDIYQGCDREIFSIDYSARNYSKGSEVMIFSEGLSRPARVFCSEKERRALAG